MDALKLTKTSERPTALCLRFVNPSVFLIIGLFLPNENFGVTWGSSISQYRVVLVSEMEDDTVFFDDKVFKEPNHFKCLIQDRNQVYTVHWIDLLHFALYRHSH